MRQPVLLTPAAYGSDADTASATILIDEFDARIPLTKSVSRGSTCPVPAASKPGFMTSLAAYADRRCLFLGFAGEQVIDPRPSSSGSSPPP